MKIVCANWLIDGLPLTSYVDSCQDLEKILAILGILAIKLRRSPVIQGKLPEAFLQGNSESLTTHTNNSKSEFCLKKKSILCCFAGIKKPETNYCGQPHKLAWTWMYLQKKYIFIFIEIKPENRKGCLLPSIPKCL